MPNNTKSRIVLLLLILLSLAAGVGIMISRSGEGKVLLPADHFPVFASKEIANFPAGLHAQGNQLVDGEGQPLWLRGMGSIDMAAMQAQKRFNTKFLANMQQAGANVVRVTVDPQAWVDDPDYMWRYLFYLVDWAGRLDLYVIITWDAAGDPATGAGLAVDHLKGLPKDLTRSFWAQNADYFRTAPNVIFELFSEPVGMPPGDWRQSAAGLVSLIRAEEFTNLILINGADASTDLSWALSDPIEDDNLAYAAHVYPGLPRERWAAAFEDAAAVYPVLVTEWGFMDENRSDEQPYLAGDQAGFGAPLMDLLQEKQIGWVAGWYDGLQAPPMFTADLSEPTHFGAFVLDRLRVNTTATP